VGTRPNTKTKEGKMQDIIFATKNKGKIKEIKEILQGYNVLSMEDVGVNIDVLEDGETFLENATKKAVAIMKITGKLTLSDDSGIEIDFLGGKPGVHSAYYLGENTPYIERNAIVLENMKDVPEKDRTARFKCVICAAFPDGKILSTEGKIEGVIAKEQRGGGGFGYDPIFLVPEYNLTTAEMPADLKNKISHRGEALRQMKELLGNGA